MNLYYVESAARDGFGDPLFAGCYCAEGLLNLMERVFAADPAMTDEVVKVYQIGSSFTDAQPPVFLPGQVAMGKVAEFRLPRERDVMLGEAEVG